MGGRSIPCERHYRYRDPSQAVPTDQGMLDLLGFRERETGWGDEDRQANSPEGF
jgi:hypothetical protein